MSKHLTTFSTTKLIILITAAVVICLGSAGAASTAPLAAEPDRVVFSAGEDLEASRLYTIRSDGLTCDGSPMEAQAPRT